MKNVFIELITHFLRVICSNQERITDITLFLRNQELFAHVHSFVISDPSESLRVALLFRATRSKVALF